MVTLTCWIYMVLNGMIDRSIGNCFVFLVIYLPAIKAAWSHIPGVWQKYKTHCHDTISRAVIAHWCSPDKQTIEYSVFFNFQFLAFRFGFWSIVEPRLNHHWSLQLAKQAYSINITNHITQIIKITPNCWQVIDKSPPSWLLLIHQCWQLQ